MTRAWLRVFSCAAVFAVMCALPAVGTAQVDSGSDAEARRRFDEGRAHFDAGEFAEAANSFRRAYVLSPRYPLLYNIGQAELRAGHDAQALEAFEGFLRQAPEDDARHSEVEERVRVLRVMGVSASTGTVVGSPSEATEATETTETTGATEGATEPVIDPAPITDRPPADSGSDPTPWIIAGVGGAVAIAGAVLLGLGVSDAASVTGAMDGAMWSELEGAAGRANAEFAAGIALLGVGVVALGVGVAWGATRGGSSSDAASVSLRVGPGSLTLSGAF